jgi:hypothetical protein
MFSHDVVIGKGMYEGFANGGTRGMAKKNPSVNGGTKSLRDTSQFFRVVWAVFWVQIKKQGQIFRCPWDRG